MKLLNLSVLTWVILLFLVACNVLLIRQNLQLRTTVEDLNAKQKIQTGSEIVPFDAVDINDQAVKVDFNDNGLKKVVLISSTSCPYCKKQNPYWNEFIEQIDSDKYEVVKIFNDREEKNKVVNFLDEAGFSEEIISSKILFLSSEVLTKNKLNSTPITLIVNKNGIVEKAWFGLWDKNIIDDVNSTTEISLNNKFH